MISHGSLSYSTIFLDFNQRFLICISISTYNSDTTYSPWNSWCFLIDPDCYTRWIRTVYRKSRNNFNSCFAVRNKTLVPENKSGCQRALNAVPDTTQHQTAVLYFPYNSMSKKRIHPQALINILKKQQTKLGSMFINSPIPESYGSVIRA